jgi:hypothetical protein
MKTRTFYSVSTFLLLLVFASCNMGSMKGIAVPADKKDYVGTWQSDEIRITIQPSGQVEYEKHSGSTTTSVSGPIQKFEGNNFVVGALGFNTTFVISAVPHQEDGSWKMTMDGQELTRD